LAPSGHAHVCRRTACRICRGRCYLPWDGNAVPYSARQKSPGCRHVHLESESSRTWLSRRQCRFYGRTRQPSVGSGTQNGRGLFERGAPNGFSRDAIQFCRLHQCIGGSPLAATRLPDRRNFTGRLSPSSGGIRRCLRHVSFVAPRLAVARACACQAEASAKAGEARAHVAQRRDVISC